MEKKKQILTSSLALSLTDSLHFDATLVGRCSLFSPLQVALYRIGSAEGEEVRKNMVPLWSPGSLGQRHGWMLTAHVALVAILGQAESI